MKPYPHAKNPALVSVSVAGASLRAHAAVTAALRARGWTWEVPFAVNQHGRWLRGRHSIARALVWTTMCCDCGMASYDVAALTDCSHSSILQAFENAGIVYDHTEKVWLRTGKPPEERVS